MQIQGHTQTYLSPLIEESEQKPFEYRESKPRLGYYRSILSRDNPDLDKIIDYYIDWVSYDEYLVIRKENIYTLEKEYKAVKTARIYGIPPSGTMAHSFVMGFKNEIDAFRAYARTFPDNSVFVIDTYDPLEGAGKAAKVAKEMERDEHGLLGVRLDSGDMMNLSEQVRIKRV